MSKAKEKVKEQKEEVKDQELNFDLEKEEENKEEEEIENKEGDSEPEGPTPDEVIAQLKAEIERKDEEAKRAKERAERLEKEKKEAVATGATAQENAIHLHEQSIDRAIDAENAKIENLEAKLISAQESGNIKDTVTAQKELAKASVALANAENAKNQFDVWKQQQETAAKQAPAGYGPEIQDWIDRHPRFNNDDEYQAETFAADTAATRMGYTPGTPAYFKYIEGRLERAFPADEKTATKTNGMGKKVIPSAAPSRDSQPSTSRQAKNWKDIDLTPAQQEAAEIAGMSEDDYKKGLMAVSKKG